MARFSSKLIARLNKFASLQFTEEETAVLLGISGGAEAITAHRVASAEFRKARLQGQAKVRALALQAAADGDAQGRRQFLELARSFDQKPAADAECRSCAAAREHLVPALQSLQIPCDNETTAAELARLAAQELRRLLD